MNHRHPHRQALAATAVLLVAAGSHLGGCTNAYMESLGHEMRLEPAELLEVRTREAGESLRDTREALVHLDDALRQFALSPMAGAEHQHTDVQRLAELVQAAALNARRRLASVHDVAPSALADVPPGSPSAHSIDEHTAAVDAADLALQSLLQRLDAGLPSLGVSPSPEAADALREPVRAVLEAIDRAGRTGDRLVRTLESPRPS